ncbi:RDD family protein [Microbacterium sediminis]|uniref:Uncharacterized protein n=1 Tax=Microbacterium sediminis TaxID=904291 RepID=A0A1B9NAJ2_9MICO|nr:RDD family protein [Microbacterium sediminis]OCG73593.1 hypothetical protein A7J15_07940 [Microbacterium sediminis]QBR73272.1 FHA domain-containing protein [Microbacterium sediminis]
MSTPQYPGYGQDPYAQQPQGPSAPWPEPAAQPYGQQPFPGAVPPAPPQPANPPQHANPYGQPYPQEQVPGYAPQPYAMPDPAAAGHYGQLYQAYAAPAPLPPLTGTPAPQGKRVAAYLIDAAIIFGIALAFILIATAVTFAVDLTAGTIVLGLMYVALLAWALVYSGMQGKDGSVGARAQRIRIASLDTGAPIGFGKALLRNVVLGVTGIVFGLGFFSILFDKTGRNQGWHDKAVGAIVLDGRPQQSPAPQADGATQAHPAAPEAPAWPAPTVDPYATILPEATSSTPAPAADPYAAAPAADPYAPAPAADPYAPAPAADPYAPAPTADPYAPAPAAPSYAAPQPGPAYPPAPPMPPAPAMPPAPSFGPGPAAAAPAPAPAAEPAPVDPFATIVPPAFSAPITASYPQQTPEPSPLSNDAVISFVPGITEDRPAVPPLPADEVSDDTVIVQRRPELKRAVLVWDDDIRHVVSLRTVFGRNPAPVEGVEAIAVRDESLSLSKTHFEVDVDEHGAWVTDRHSTNGVEIVRGGQRQKITPGERIRLETGDTLQMGDREVTIEAIT